jgi:hypothetical protein
MSNITQLPDSFERQWRVYEGQLQTHFAAAGASLDEIDHAAAKLKPIYLDAARMNFTSGATGDALVQELNAWVNQQVFGMMTHIALRDVELYRLRGG